MDISGIPLTHGQGPCPCPDKDPQVRVHVIPQIIPELLNVSVEGEGNLEVCGGGRWYKSVVRPRPCAAVKAV